MNFGKLPTVDLSDLPKSVFLRLNQINCCGLRGPDTETELPLTWEEPTMQKRHAAMEGEQCVQS